MIGLTRQLRGSSGLCQGWKRKASNCKYLCSIGFDVWEVFRNLRKTIEPGFGLRKLASKGQFSDAGAVILIVGAIAECMGPSPK